MRTLLGNVALAVGSVLVVVVGLELATRVAGFQSRGTWSAPCYERHEDIGHLFVPGYRGTLYKGISTGWKHIPARINSHGLRGADFPLAKPPGVKRILVLGDSFVFGYLLPEDESMPSILQRLLDERRGRGRVQVINAGVPGYALTNERAYLEGRGLAFAPDLVVVASSTGDVADAGRRKKADDAAEENVGAEFTIYRAERQSSLLTFMRYLLFGAVARLDPKLALGRGLHAETLTPAARRAWGRHAREFGRLATVARTHHVPLVLAVYPTELQLYSDNTRLQGRWEELARSESVPFIDVLDAFKAARRSALYVPADGHPAAAANEIVARAILAWLEQERMPGAPL
jgi:lysophospholipase L1-like esterase